MPRLMNAFKIAWSDMEWEERLFWMAFLLSVLIHGFLCLAAWLPVWYGAARKVVEPKLVYYRPVLPEQNIEKDIPEAETIQETRRRFIPDHVPWRPSKTPWREEVDRPKHSVLGDVRTGRHKMAVSAGADQKRVVALSFAENARIKNPAYTAYGTHVRMKIRNQAYYYVDDPRFDKGKVYVTFVIEQSGRLAAVQILDARTQASDFLKRVALQSVKEAAPFAPFPKELDYPELTFNVIISFEMD